MHVHPKSQECQLYPIVLFILQCRNTPKQRKTVDFIKVLLETEAETFQTDCPYLLCKQKAS